MAEIEGRVVGIGGLFIRSADSASQREAMAGVGRFAGVYDADGNPVELWEPE